MSLELTSLRMSLHLDEFVPTTVVNLSYKRPTIVKYDSSIVLCNLGISQSV